MKRVIVAWLVLLMLILCCIAPAGADGTENLVSNGGFEERNASGNPEGWYTKAYRNQAGYSRMTITDEKAHSGHYSVVIDNASSNDARFLYTAQVEPESMYRLSGYVLVEYMEDVGNGANFGIENIYSFSDCLFDTNGEWVYLEWYGETGEKQKELTFGVRVGGYSAESTGKAYFDDISLVKVDTLPENVFASIWYEDTPVAARQETTKETNQEKSTGMFLVIGLCFVSIVFCLQFHLEKTLRLRYSTLLFVSLLTAGLVIRVILALRIHGYQVDINCFTAWSMRMAKVGPLAFYSSDMFCDYPPGAMLLLWPTGLVLNNGGYQSSVQLLIVKSLPICFDLLGSVCLYGWIRKKSFNTNASLLSVFYLFNPAVLVNGAAWGQVDSVLAFFMLLTALFAMDRKWNWAIPLFAVSTLTKPQALLFAPIGGMWLLFGLIDQSNAERKTEIRSMLIGVLAAVVIALIIVVPFSIHQEQPISWLFKLYGDTLSSYAYATLNTANLYYLIGANWRALDQLVPQWLSISSATIFLVLGVVALLWKSRAYDRSSRQKRWTVLGGLSLLAAFAHFVFAVCGAAYFTYGYSMMALGYLMVIILMSQDRKAASLPFYMSLALIAVYVLGVKVHERYLFPALLLMLCAYATTGDRRVLWLCAGFSITTFINTAIVLDNSILYGAAQGHLNTDTLTINRLLCVTNLLLTGFGVWIGVSGLRCSPSVAREAEPTLAVPESYRRLLLKPADPRMKLILRDYVLMGAVTLVYAVVAFTHLGSTVAPQTAWISTSDDEQVVFDLGEEQEFSLLYYGGVSYNNFSVSVSSDGENWSDPYPCQMREGMCWQWKYVVSSHLDGQGNPQFSGESPSSVQWFNARYVRLNAEKAGLNLWELVARNREGQNLPLVLSTHIGARSDMLNQPQPADNLVDEMSTCIGEPSWYNSMYFDEIYHAREAYHNLHGETTYEWTHPPLGKLLMAVGVAIFGMTPFGWRFAGTLIGVLMLPALYLLGMQLTKKRTVAALSMMAFALDLMHFTQTRIATIDSFPLLFILLSYVCMIRYMHTDLFELAQDETPKLFTKAFWKSLLPLFLCGFMMGLSIASKWTGVYSAVGLAVLFFLTVWRQERASKFSFDLELDGCEWTEEENKRIQNAQNYTFERILITCGFCVLFFVVIPLGIYVLSYIPQLTPSGPFTLERVIRTQENMLSYHATPGLGMDHPFQSPWWQWPFILKPIWYVQDRYEPAGFGSTIMCLGNPWVFYIGAFAMVGVVLLFVHKYIRIGKNGLAFKRGDGDLTLLIIVVGFFAQYLPWMLVPRSMYIYHYFASVPFIILSTAWLVQKINKPVWRWAAMLLYLIGALVFFVMFFPYASGIMTNTAWLDAMKWFSRLYY